MNVYNLAAIITVFVCAAGCHERNKKPNSISSTPSHSLSSGAASSASSEPTPEQSLTSTYANLELSINNETNLKPTSNDALLRALQNGLRVKLRLLLPNQHETMEQLLSVEEGSPGNSPTYLNYLINTSIDTSNDTGNASFLSSKFDSNFPHLYLFSTQDQTLSLDYHLHTQPDDTLIASYVFETPNESTSTTQRWLDGATLNDTLSLITVQGQSHLYNNNDWAKQTELTVDLFDQFLSNKVWPDSINLIGKHIASVRRGDIVFVLHQHTPWLERLDTQFTPDNVDNQLAANEQLINQSTLEDLLGYDLESSCLAPSDLSQQEAITALNYISAIHLATSTVQTLCITGNFPQMAIFHDTVFMSNSANWDAAVRKNANTSRGFSAHKISLNDQIASYSGINDIPVNLQGHIESIHASETQPWLAFEIWDAQIQESYYVTNRSDTSLSLFVSDAQPRISLPIGERTEIYSTSHFVFDAKKREDLLWRSNLISSNYLVYHDDSEIRRLVDYPVTIYLDDSTSIIHDIVIE